MREIHVEVTEDEKISRLTAVLMETCSAHGFDYATFGVWNLPDATSFAATTYPKSWAEHYVANDYHLHDPVLQISSRATSPVDWEQLKPFDTHGVFKAAEKWGLGNHGISIPIIGGHGEIALLSAAKCCTPEYWEELKRTQLDALEAASVKVHEIALETWNISSKFGFDELDKREHQVLQLTAYGKSYKEISSVMDVSHRMVETALANARDKLSALNTNQAVARAIGLQLITPC